MWGGGGPRADAREKKELEGEVWKEGKRDEARLYLQWLMPLSRLDAKVKRDQRTHGRKGGKRSRIR